MTTAKRVWLQQNDTLRLQRDGQVFATVRVLQVSGRTVQVEVVTDVDASAATPTDSGAFRC